MKVFRKILGIPSVDLLEQEKFQIAFANIKVIANKVIQDMKERQEMMEGTEYWHQESIKRKEEDLKLQYFQELLQLLEQEGNVNTTTAVNIYGAGGAEEIRAPLVYASLIGDPIITSILLSAGSRNQLHKALMIAAEKGHQEIVEPLLERMDNYILDLEHNGFLDRIIIHLALSEGGEENVNKIMEIIGRKFHFSISDISTTTMKFLGRIFPDRYGQIRSTFSSKDFINSSGLTFFLAYLGDEETISAIRYQWRSRFDNLSPELAEVASILEGLQAKLIEEFRENHSPNPELSAIRLLTRFALIDYPGRGICTRGTAMKEAISSPRSTEVKAGIGKPFDEYELNILTRVLIAFSEMSKVGFEEKYDFEEKEAYKEGYIPFISPLLEELRSIPRGEIPSTDLRSPSMASQLSPQEEERHI